MARTSLQWNKTRPSCSSSPTVDQKNTLLLFYLLVVVFTLSAAQGECPKVCECKWKSGKESVACLNSGLKIIPEALDAGTQVLDLTGNILKRIDKDAFLNAGLLNLQKIYLPKCQIKELNRDTFRKLTNLVELDLNYNALQYVPSHVFDAIPELRELKLSGNPIQRIMNNAFASLPQLVRLELSDCRLGTIEPRGLHGLESLEWLKLDGNMLARIEPTVITPLRSIHGVDLHGNPWNCSCDLRPLREWMLRGNIPYSVPPLCSNPKRITGKTWDKLDLDEFACTPDIVTLKTPPSAHGTEGRNITMSCHVEGTPEPNVKWLWKNRVIANLSTGVTYGKQQMYVLRETGKTHKISNLTITTVDLQDAGTYICIAENKAGKVETNVTLTVSRRVIENVVGGRIVVAGIIVIGLFLLAICLVITCVCSIRKRQMDITNVNNTVSSGDAVRRGARRDDSYEKIEMNHKGPVGLNHTSNKTRRGSYLGVPGGKVSGANTVKAHPKHGEYRGVPNADIDMCDSETEMMGGSAESRLWTVRSELRKGDSYGSDHCLTVDADDSVRNASVSESGSETRCNAIPTDLHRPLPYQQADQAGSDATSPPSKSSGDTIIAVGLEQNSSPPLFQRFPPAPSSSAQMNSNTNPRFQSVIGGGSNTSSTASSVGSYNISKGETGSLIPEKNYPDLLEINANQSTVNYYTSESFCTLPRKRYGRGGRGGRYRVGGESDSQSPLLPEGRYSSEGSSNNSIRRSSVENCYPLLGGGGQRSTSSLNLPSDTRLYGDGNDSLCVGGAGGFGVTGSGSGVPMSGGRRRFRNPSLPTSPSFESPPSSAYRTTSGSGGEYGAVFPSSSSNVAAAAAYDYHAAQLERFLEEYRELQEQLCKMKETCDSLRHDSPGSVSSSGISVVSNPRYSGELQYSGAQGGLSSSEDTPKSILKNKPNVSNTTVVSPSDYSGGGMSSGSSGTPDMYSVSTVKPYWVPHNPGTGGRRYSGGDFYQT